ncbi:MAG: cell division protein FtsA [Clostridium butyricum]|nr:cell division protein FtsA [Clostridium butyricum]
MQQEIITSIDFGSKKLSASMATSNKECEMDILGVKSCKSMGIEKGLVTDVEKCKSSVISLLKDLEASTKKEISNVYIGISARKVSIKEMRVSCKIRNEKITKLDIISGIKKAKEKVMLEGNECIIDTIINFYILDGKVLHKDVINLTGSELELNLTVIIGKVDEIQKYYDIFKSTKYSIKCIMLNIFSGKHIFLNGTNAMGDVALVDVGAGKTDICLFNNGVPKNISSIPIGGNNISNDLAICGKFSFMEADNIKIIYSENYESLYRDQSLDDDIEVGTIKVSKELFYEVTNARIEEILTHINMELKKTGHYDRICSIILYGDGLSYFENINKFVRTIIERKTKIVTKMDLGLKNSENITSLALAKEVYDRFNLLEDNDKTKIVEEVQTNETEFLLDENEGRSPILERIKTFLGKIF